MARESDEQNPVLISMRPPTRGQQRLVLAAGLILLGLFLVALPFRGVQLRRVDLLLPIFLSVTFLADVITSALLLAKFAVLRKPALLLLASGYLFTGLIVVVRALTAPGLFSSSGLLGAGPQSSDWLFIASHFMFPATLIAYALLKDGEHPRKIARGSVSVVILASIVGILCLVVGLTWLTTVHHDVLPPVVRNEIDAYPIPDKVIAPALLLVCAATVALLWMRRRSLLDLWLLLVAWAWLLESMLLSFVDKAFTVDWYATRSLAITAATFVLIALLCEMTTLYARLALSAMAQRREREGRLMTMDVLGASIAHEVNQPLMAIIANGKAGLHWLDQETPDVGRAMETVKAMIDDGHRAGLVIARVRGIFRRGEPDKGYVDINAAIEDVLALVQGEVRRHGIVVDAALDPTLTRVNASKAQLQQVLLNLIANAIDTMDRDGVWLRALRIHTEPIDREVLVSVEDTGLGVDWNTRESIFDPVFGPKSGGVGLGLPICRSIIEAHGGRMWAARGATCGTALRFTLPLADARHSKREARVDQPRFARTLRDRPLSGFPATPAQRARTTSVRPTAVHLSDEFPLLLSTRPPGRRQKRIAVLVGLLMLGVFVVILPFAQIQLGQIKAYIPAAATAMCINDTITSALLFAQFAVLRTFALLVLAAGYLLTGLLLLAYMLVYPAEFSPIGLLDAGPQSAPWIFMFRLFGFPAVVFAYALLKDGKPDRHVAYGAERTAVLVSVVGVLCVVIALTWLATAHHDILPILVRNGAGFKTFTFGFHAMASASALLCAVVIAFLWVRWRSLLGVWLLVVMWAWLLNSVLLLLMDDRYEVAWYASVAFALVSATCVLLVLLSETTIMHAQLALSVLAHRQEQGGRLMTMDAVAASIAHEINQPLAAIVNNGSAALRWLARATPDVGEARKALRAMLEDGSRARRVIEAIRSVLRRDQPEKEDLDINAVIEEVLVHLRGELSSRGIVLKTALDTRLPLFSANRIQLQQVFLNLIANATEAIERAALRPSVLRIGTAYLGDEVLVTVEDNGVGIKPHDSEHIFDPFFTTKERGTGLGLAICRSIVEAHGGRMWAAPGQACGTVLRFTLPLADQG